ncbi:MAG: hypothetical protein M1294_01155 [Firmicutes bacterium]|uniref:DUF4199 domain-containing protein n=1 Tax=Sulfobacillus benefaciens TaxID=453960 RepID=A0A2T2WT78_9FIRM|nr:hypothetical protein [Bacillota bacterium]MCL5013451.1 hypothetical protein [Bacillota bacterium]PSR25402.1 MAG: hypothetical protein C7B43_16875 [Sulfobacillus benefaciens]
MKTIIFRMYLITAAWAILVAVIHVVIIEEHSVEPIVLSTALTLGVAVIVFLSGRTAKIQGGSSWRVGAVAGGIYGLLSGWPVLLIHVTRAQLVAELHGRSLTPSEISLSLHMANSPIIHLLAWLSSVVIGLVLGLIVGALGGVTAKRPGSTLDI